MYTPGFKWNQWFKTGCENRRAHIKPRLLWTIVHLWKHLYYAASMFDENNQTEDMFLKWKTYRNLHKH